MLKPSAYPTHAKSTPQILDQIYYTIRLNQYFYRTEATYIHSNNSAPHISDRKYPNASRKWIWQYVFSTWTRCQDTRSGQILRYHFGIVEKGIKSRKL